MPIELPRETEKEIITSIKLYFAEEMGDEIGYLKAKLLYDFILEEVGPSIYNRAIADAQVYLQERLLDLDASLYQVEFGYSEKRKVK